MPKGGDLRAKRRSITTLGEDIKRNLVINTARSFKGSSE